MVIFHSYVSLPEGMGPEKTQISIFLAKRIITNGFGGTPLSGKPICKIECQLVSPEETHFFDD
jgi:hypothetical protein